MEIFTQTWDILVELAPWLFFGALISGFMHVLLPKQFIKRHLGKPGFASVLKAAIIGVPMPLCSCSVIPTGLALKKDGAGNGAALSFIISTPQTGIDSIAVTVAFLGWPFAIFKVFAAFFTGIIGGLLADRGDEGDEGDKSEDEQSNDPISERSSCCGESSGSDSSKKNNTPMVVKVVRAMSAALHFAVWELLHSIWRWLLIGVLISAAITTYLPDLMFISEANSMVTMLLVLLISIPLYVCATASVPIAASLVLAGFPMGAALVFLMAGPATNIATIGAVGKVLGKRVLIIYLTVVIGASLALGIVYNIFIDGAFTAAISTHQHGDHSIIAEISAYLLLCLCALFAWVELRQRWIIKKNSSCCGPEFETAPKKSCCEAPVEIEAKVATSCCAPKPQTAPKKPCCGDS